MEEVFRDADPVGFDRMVGGRNRFHRSLTLEFAGVENRCLTCAVVPATRFAFPPRNTPFLVVTPTPTTRRVPTCHPWPPSDASRNRQTLARHRGDCFFRSSIRSLFLSVCFFLFLPSLVRGTYILGYMIFLFFSLFLFFFNSWSWFERYVLFSFDTFLVFKQGARVFPEF